MTNNTYRHAIVDYVRTNANPPDKFSHQPRLYALARNLAGSQPFDDDVLHAAAWLHDIGVFIGHRPEDPKALAKWDNVAYAVEKVPSLLQDFGFPQRKIAAVIDVIRTHLPSGAPTSFEGTLLRDADILEQLGAIAILRTVSKVGRDTRFIRFADAVASLRKSVEQLPAQLRLPSARQAAAAKIEVLNTFLSAAEAETNGTESKP